MPIINSEIKNLDLNTDSLDIRFKTRLPMFKEIEYLGIVNKVEIERNVKTKYGIGHKAIVEYGINVEEFDGTLNEKPLKQIYYISQSKQSRFAKMYETLTGESIGKQISLRNLIGKKCVVTISHYTNQEGDVYDNVASIRRLKDSIDITKGTL